MTQSGRSGRSTLRGPGVEVDAPHRDDPEQRQLVVDDGVVDHPGLSLPRGRGKRGGLEPVGRVLRRVLLEEALPLPPVRVALHRERPRPEVRHDGWRDRAVVREQIALRDSLLGPEGLVEVREPQRPPTTPDLVGERRHLSHDLGLRSDRHGSRDIPARGACRRRSTPQTRPRRPAGARPSGRLPHGSSRASGTTGSGVVVRARPRSTAARRASSAPLKPDPTLPTWRSSPPSRTASTRAPIPREREPSPGVQPTTTNSCRSRELDLDPVRRPRTLAVAALRPLGHHAFEPLLATGRKQRLAVVEAR